MKQHKKHAVRKHEEWAEYNARQDDQLERWGTLNTTELVVVEQFIKHGFVRWEAQLGVHTRLSTTFVPHLIWCYRNKSEATAKGVELVLKGYAARVIDG